MKKLSKTERIFNFPAEKLEEKFKFEKTFLKNVKKLLKTERIFNFPVEKLEETLKFEKTF